MARVLVTRASGRGDALIEGLRAAGVEVVEVNLLAFEATGATLPTPMPGDWLLLSSATTIGYILEQSLDFLKNCSKIAVIGPATARALRAAGREPTVMPDEALGARLVDAMGPLGGRRVLYPRAEVVPPGLEDALRAAGAEVLSTPLYRTVCPPGAAEALRALGPVDLVALASGSAARHLAATGVFPPQTSVVAIGPSTAEVAEGVGLRVVAVADPHTSEGLAEAALEVIRRGASSDPS